MLCYAVLSSGADHGFKLRGQSYKTDGKKVPAGPPLSRLLAFETYLVDVAREGLGPDGHPTERHDHVAARGVCRRRLEAVLCLRDPPFLYVMNFQLPGDPPVSMVSYFALAPHLCRGLGVLSSVPERFRRPRDCSADEPLPKDILKAMQLFEKFCDFPKTEFERLALWGIEGDSEDQREVCGLGGEGEGEGGEGAGQNCTVNRSRGELSRGPSCVTDDGAGSLSLSLSGDGGERDSSVYSDNTGSGTTGAWSASLHSGVDAGSASQSQSQQSGDRTGSAAGGKRYQKALRKEAEARDKQKEAEASHGHGHRPGMFKIASDGSHFGIEKPKKRSLLQRMGITNPKPPAPAPRSPSDTFAHDEEAARAAAAPSAGPVAAHVADVTHTGNGIGAGAGVSAGAGAGAVSAGVCVPGDARSVASAGSTASAPAAAPASAVSVPAPKKAAPAARPAKSGWKMPSDICWADPHDKGVFPPEDIRNTRFKLTPRIVDGPWVVKAAVPTQPAILGQKVVIRYFRGNGYVEADIHVGSSIIASQVVGILRGYAKHFVSEVGVTLQGEGEEELPEKLFASILLVHPDPSVNRPLDEER
jgi:hypothetical protein